MKAGSSYLQRLGLVEGCARTSTGPMRWMGEGGVVSKGIEGHACISKVWFIIQY